MRVPSEPDAPRFQVDGMAIRLGRYLRCLGWDALGDARLTTRLAAARAHRAGRVLLTRNSRIGSEFQVPGAWLALLSQRPLEQLAQVRAEFDLGARAAFSRCLDCNVRLEEITDREALRDRVLPRVLARHRRFFRCPSCDGVFWLGGHVARTCALLGIPAPEGTRG